MAIGMKGMIDAVQLLQAKDTSSGLGERPGGGKPPAQVNQAFEQQMKMAQSLLSDGDSNLGSGAGQFDTSFLNDAMMFDALATISRIMQQTGTEGPTSVPIPQAVQAAVSSQPVANNPAQATSGTTSSTKPQSVAQEVEGFLSAQFESGNKGIEAIGWDSTGGTSYGKYQIASKTGTMDRFLNYLDDKAPELAQRLRSAGPAETGGTTGAMPKEWKSIATEMPEHFEKLQHGFIKGEHYDTARNMIRDKTGIDLETAPPIVKEVLWSTSVQHGPTGASNIFSKAINAFLGRTEGGEFSRKLIEQVYDTRKGQFGSSTERVRQAVGNRLESEKEIALNMLSGMQVNRTA